MGYRSAWLNHAGLGSRHFEVVIHALDRNLPVADVRFLVVGVENGGTVEVLQSVLPEGSEVVGVDINPACADLGIPMVVGDVRDEGWFRGEFRGQWFDLILDSTGTMCHHLWPFLTPGGRLMFEGYEPERMVSLARDLANDRDSWLPTEEIMRVEMFPHIAVVEKRNPRVVPYLEIMVGNFFDAVPESDLVARGMKRVVV